MTLRNTVIAFFLILAAVVVTKTDRTGSAAGSTSERPANSSTAVRCSISPQRVTAKNNTIVAAGQFRCDSPGPDKLTLVVHLQRQDGAQWTTVTGQTFVTNSTATTRKASVADRTRQVSVPCSAGTFRTWLEASVVDNNVTRGLSEFGDARKNPCS